MIGSDDNDVIFSNGTNASRDNDDTVLDKSKAVGFSNYEDGRKIVPKNDRESDDNDVIFNNGTNATRDNDDTVLNKSKRVILKTQ